MRITFQTRIASVALAMLCFSNLLTVKADEAADKEAELIAVLQSDAAPGDKGLACKKLTVYGTSKAVPELAKLLTDEHLASWARIPLEAIPGPEADHALRTAAETVKGRLLVGTLNSIGVRRDAKAVELLTKYLQDQDGDVAAAAAVALGRTGDASAVKALQTQLASAAPAQRSFVAEGLVLSAEQRRLDGRDAEAVALYDEVRNAQVPKQRIREATRGAILARKKDGIPLLLEQFRSFDKGLFQIALSTAREFPGQDVDQALAKEITTAAPDRAALIITAMADRPETVVLPAILKAAGPGPKEVRLAAISALGRVGNTSCLPSMLEYGVENDDEIVQLTKKSLTDIPGENVDKYIQSRLAKAEGKVYPLLLELVGTRRISAIPELLKAIDNSDATVRHTALKSLGTTAPPDKLSVLIKQSVAPKNADDAPVAQAALKVAAVRMPDREVCAKELSTAFEGKAPVTAKIALLKILADVAGTKALQTIGQAAKNPDVQIHDVASELLGDWLTIDAAPVLLDLVKTAPSEKYQIRAMRGYIRIPRQFAMDDETRIDMIKKATEASFRTAERKAVIDVLKRYPNMETLKLAIKANQDPELKDDAAGAILLIAGRLTDKVGEVRPMIAKVEFPKVNVEIVKAEYGADANQKDVTDIVKKQLGNTQLILLPSDNYSESFGGDPAPGTPKKLKIQYKLNDVPGEVALPENSLVILPIPKEKK